MCSHIYKVWTPYVQFTMPLPHPEYEDAWHGTWVTRPLSPLLSPLFPCLYFHECPSPHLWSSWPSKPFKLQKLVPHRSCLSSLECELCQLREHTCISYPNHLFHRTKSPFEPVHTDVWSPSRSESTLGCHYFVTFLSYHYTWLCLNEKSSRLISYLSKISRWNLNSIQCFNLFLRSDNTKEYISGSFSSFMSPRGTRHQSSCG